MILAEIPYTRTGPATVNIFAPTPITYPSDLYSMAGETIEFANPVIGTSEPAPANFPILLKQFNAVRKLLIKISEIETMVYDISSLIPFILQISKIICPIAQIKPPNPKCVKAIFYNGGVRCFFVNIFLICGLTF